MSTTDDIENLRRCEQQRCAAILSRSLASLSEVLHEDLVYVHATGTWHDKQQLLDFIDHGPRFLSVALQAPEPVVIGETAIVAGELRLTLLRAGETQPVQARSWAIALWQRSTEGRFGWQLRHFQSTRMAA